MYNIREVTKRNRKDIQIKQKKIIILCGVSDKNRKMHGIQHLFRQHAVEKQMSAADSWSNGSSHNSHVPIADGYSSSRNDSIESESDSSVTSKSPNNWNQGELLTGVLLVINMVIQFLFSFFFVLKISHSEIGFRF